MEAPKYYKQEAHTNSWKHTNVARKQHRQTLGTIQIDGNTQVDPFIEGNCSRVQTY